MATFFVDSNVGNNAFSCVQAQNEATPKATIAHGIACMSAGDTVMVKNGNYPSDPILNPPGGTGPSGYSVIRNYPGHRPRIFGPVIAIQLLQGQLSSYIRIQGFDIDGTIAGYQDFGESTSFSQGLPPGSGHPHHNQLIDCWIHDTDDTAWLGWHDVDVQNGAGGDHLIQGNEFWNIGIGSPGYFPGMNCIYNMGHRTIIENNIFHNCIHVISWNVGSGYVNNVIVRNNILYNNFMTDIDTWMQGVEGGGGILATQWGGGHQIYNNILYNNGPISGTNWVGITAAVSSATPNLQSDVLIANNTIYNNRGSGQLGIHNDNFTTINVTIRNNIVYQTAGIAGGSLVTNNLQTDPMFVNSAGADFHLTAGSAARNAGVTVAQVTTDFDGVIRPQGAAYDIGAFEFVEGSPPGGDTTRHGGSFNKPIFRRIRYR